MNSPKNNQRKKILVIHPEESFRNAVTEMTANQGYFCDHASSGTMALELLGKAHFHIVISAGALPQMDSLELIQVIKKRYPETDVLVISENGQGHSPGELINAGCSDFMALPLSEDHLTARLYKIEKEKALRTELYRKSITDELTSLYNRRFFYTKLNEEINRAKRQDRGLSLIMFDVDGFKKFNDKYGHLGGDALLRVVASIIQSSIREFVDSGFRYGGDEFTIILPEAEEETASSIGERIQKRFKETASGGLTLSMGMAQFEKEFDCEDLINLADKRMYQAKRQGRDLILSQLEADIGRDNFYIRCVNCQNLVHWASLICENCLADPRKKEAAEVSTEGIIQITGEGLEKERRKSPRVRLHKAFMYNGFQATIINIGRGGLQIKTRTPLSTGQAVTIAFPLSGRIINMEGKVAHTRLSSDGSLIAGLPFARISEDHASIIANFLEEKLRKKSLSAEED